MSEVLKTRLLVEDLAVWRAGGWSMVWMGLCVCRDARFIMDCAKKNEIICRYHGRHNCEGRYTMISAHPDLSPPGKSS